MPNVKNVCGNVFTKTQNGLCDTKEYRTLKNLKNRCYWTKHVQYKDYGGRGIKVCQRWLDSFLLFYNDMGMAPGPEYTIDRRDNDGDYTPENCFWATRKHQNNNKRSNRIITFNGETMTLIQWAEKLGMRQSTLSGRINTMKWTIERALTEPIKKP